MSQLSKEGRPQFNKLISTSSSTDVRKINEQILAYLIIKLSFSDNNTVLMRLCDVMNELSNSTDKSCIQQIRAGMPEYTHMYIRTTFVAMFYRDMGLRKFWCL